MFIVVYTLHEIRLAKREKRVLHLKPSGVQLGNAAYFIMFIATLNCFAEIAILLIMPSVQSVSEELNASNLLATSGGPVLTLLASGILAPVVEELLFRHGLQRLISKFNPLLSLIITSLLFGVMHGNLLQILFAVLMGFALGLVYEATQNIFYPIAMHVYVNVSGCIISMLHTNEFIAYGVAVIVPLCVCIALQASKYTERLEVNCDIKSQSQTRDNLT
jgi:membrane protease YdiL (CAAX protease family)